MGTVVWPDCNLAVKGFHRVQRPGRRLLAQSLAIDLALAYAYCGGRLRSLAPGPNRLWEAGYRTAQVVAADGRPRGKSNRRESVIGKYVSSGMRT